ncbi:anaerobic ribonucleoside-triphosphate reductase activating protein [Crassaminicella profunda]|uniref:anaerobic ribonucleoside-triphosphate reductase activating protein n=1 Tax=Crassaminicella profunda TaxID=1286698 RepID=UPI001CA68F5C|nr:anaerobic ribonucleoside-triphosphate reductase activating protein [Crassaminicella profunda]QZY54777.1 anaerobic ribonucleoside-triphosphate reductase activating protein [Crassaminicella profunda]
MNIIGQEKASFIDYPDKISIVYFCSNCNMLCKYCHNYHLVKGQGETIDHDEIFAFLKKRKKFVDAVCISGGEPTLHRGLYDFAKRVKDTGYLVKLDTNGSNPEVVKRLIHEKIVDYVAMDIKAPFHKYETVIGTNIDIKAIKNTIDLLRNSHIDYEFRTTVCKELLTKEDILEIANYLKGSKRYSIQNFRDGETVLVGENKLHPYDIETLEEIEKELEGYFEVFKIRK